jgi:predicted transcriptional regulator
MPAFEGFCRAMQEMREGKGWVPQGEQKKDGEA